MKKSTLHRLIFSAAIFVDALLCYHEYTPRALPFAFFAFVLPLFVWNAVSE